MFTINVLALICAVYVNHLHKLHFENDSETGSGMIMKEGDSWAGTELEEETENL